MDQTNNTEDKVAPSLPHNQAPSGIPTPRKKWITFITTVIAASILLATGVPVPPGVADAIITVFGA